MFCPQNESSWSCFNVLCERLLWIPRRFVMLSPAAAWRPLPWIIHCLDYGWHPQCLVSVWWKDVVFLCLQHSKAIACYKAACVLACKPSLWQQAQKYLFFSSSQTDTKPVEVKHLQLSISSDIIPASLFRETSGLQRRIILSTSKFSKVTSQHVSALQYQSSQLENN